jgi:hypothetical protein
MTFTGTLTHLKTEMSRKAFTKRRPTPAMTAGVEAPVMCDLRVTPLQASVGRVTRPEHLQDASERGHAARPALACRVTPGRSLRAKNPGEFNDTCKSLDPPVTPPVSGTTTDGRNRFDTQGAGPK